MLARVACLSAWEPAEVSVLTMKGKYGLKAMLHLAELGPDKWAMSSEIAARNGISKKFLDAILAELRSAGFVRAKKGRGGGYRLLRPATEVKVGHVIRVIDGPLAPIACASRTAHVPCADCPDENVCAIRLLMLDVRNAITAILDETSLAHLQRLGAPAAAIMLEAAPKA